MLKRLLLALRTVFLRRRLEREMQEEMAAHLRQATVRLRARGLSPEEARRVARREFGHFDSLQEQAQDARGSRWIESLVADLRSGLRHFSKMCNYDRSARAGRGREHRLFHDPAFGPYYGAAGHNTQRATGAYSRNVDR